MPETSEGFNSQKYVLVATAYLAIIILHGPCNAALLLEPKWRRVPLVALQPRTPTANLLGEIMVLWLSKKMLFKNILERVCASRGEGQRERETERLNPKQAPYSAQSPM